MLLCCTVQEYLTVLGLVPSVHWFCTLTSYCIAPVNSTAWDPKIEPPRYGAAIGALVGDSACESSSYITVHVQILDLSPLFRSFVLV